MDFVNSLSGMVQVRLVSADPAAAMTAIHLADIPVFHAERVDGDITTNFLIQRKDLKRLRGIAQRRGYEVKLNHRWGIYWSIKQAFRRPILMAGVLLFLILAFWLPSRVLFFRVEGAQAIPDRLILEKCQECGIRFGASRREVRSEKMKNALLGAIPELQWAGVNTSGCVATISVRERTVSEESSKTEGVSSIVATKDGVITQCTVIRGNLLCKVGQAVQAGEVLVSGYTDCGISIQATRAEGEIFARTDRDLQVVTPALYGQRGGKASVTKKYALIIGKKRINLYKGSGISGTTCDKIYSESWLTLPGGFSLPVALVTESWTSYQNEDVNCSEEMSQQLLQQFSKTYLQQQMIAGTVLSREEVLDASDGVYTLRGKYACTEMIGKVQKEEIIKPNG